MSDYYPSDRPTPDGSHHDEPSAKDKATETAQAGKQAATDVAQTAVGKAQDVVGETAAQARNVLGEARDQLSSHVDDQHANAVTNLRALAEELKSMAENGHQSDQSSGVATDLVGKAADRAQNAASWLEARSPGDLVEEVRTFARQRPGAFLAGAVLAGVLAGRLTRGAVAAHSNNSGGGSAGEVTGNGTQELAPSPVLGDGADAGQHAYGTEYGAGYAAPAPTGLVLPDPYVNQAVPAEHGALPGQYGAQPGQYGEQPGQYGEQLGQYGEQPGQYGEQPGQYGAQPGQYGAQPEWDPARYSSPEDGR